MIRHIGVALIAMMLGFMVPVNASDVSISVGKS